MREFSTFEELARYLLRVARAVPRENERAAKDIGKHVVAAAKGKLGDYQLSFTTPDGFSFPQWAPLAEATNADRISQGYPPDEPLLREGDLRDSISFTVSGAWHADTITVGTPSTIGFWQEFGTPDAAHPIQPRPFIGSSMAESLDWNLKRMRQAVEDAFRKTN
jgi:hypothetical protein